MNKMMAGNMTLVDQVNAAQLAIQTAIRKAASPEILQMFIKKENGAMRSRLSSLEQDLRLGRISQAVYEAQAGEIIALLEKLKEPLAPHERELLNKVAFIYHVIYLFDDVIEAINTLLCADPEEHVWLRGRHG